MPLCIQAVVVAGTTKGSTNATQYELPQPQVGGCVRGAGGRQRRGARPPALDGPRQRYSHRQRRGASALEKKGRIRQQPAARARAEELLGARARGVPGQDHAAADGCRRGVLHARHLRGADAAPRARPRGQPDHAGGLDRGPRDHDGSARSRARVRSQRLPEGAPVPAAQQEARGQAGSGGPRRRRVPHIHTQPPRRRPPEAPDRRRGPR